MGSVRVVRGGVRGVSAAVSDERWPRRVTEVDEQVTINEVRNGPGSASAWHHHGDNVGCVYVAEGRMRVEWGSGGSESAELDAGDSYVISPNAIHRESNPGDSDQIVIAFLLGSGPMFVDVDGPEPR